MPLGATETGLGAVTAHGWGMGSGAGLAGLGGPAGLGQPGLPMHRFGAAGLEGLGGLGGLAGYVGSTGLICGPSGPVSGPWRAIGAGLARLGGRRRACNDYFHCLKPQCWACIQYRHATQGPMA